MTRKKGLLASLLGIRPKTYRLGRSLGDLNALTRGPGAIGKRVVRKRLYKQFSQILRKFGL